MRRNLIFLIILFSLIQLSGEWIDITENRGAKLFEHTSYGRELTEVHFSLPGYEIEAVTENGETYQKLSYWNEGEILEIGKPDLPCFTRLIAIPNTGNASVEVLGYEEEIHSNMIVYPQQELQSESQPLRTDFTMDEIFYSSGEIYPAVLSEVGEPAILRGLRVVNLTIYPFRYDPQTRELTIIKNIDVIVRTEGSGGENTVRREMKLSRAFEPLYRATVLNYDSTVSREDNFQEPSYLFIHTNGTSVEDILAYLTDWKHQKGFEVATHGVNSGTSFATIKSYVQTAYDTWENPPEFVCLVGDAEGSYNIPTDYAGYGGGDHGYARLDGTDILADVYMGRLSFNNTTEFQTIVNKILHYEKEPYLAQTDWYTKTLLVGDPSSSGTSCIDTKQHIKKMMLQHDPDYNFTEVYSGSFSSQMTTNINSGVSYFNYRGYIGMSGFYTSNIYALNNGFMLPVAVIPTCGTGTFYSGDANSEVFVKAGSPTSPKGAIASVGTATSSTHTCFNNCLDAGTYYGIFADKIFNMGGALTRGKLALYMNYPQLTGSYVTDFSYWNSLMGDPGLELWTGVPQPLTVSYDNQIFLGANTMLVNVQDDTEQPVENAWVTALLGNDDIFATGWTDANGDIVLEIDAQDVGTATLTVTKHDYIPHLGSFDVGQADRFVNVFEYDIDDDNAGDSSGNDDGIINPGETIEFRISLKNFGTFTANGVTAAISSPDTYITITDNTETYGTIAPGTSVYSADDFDFSVDADVLGGMEIHLQINITDNLGNEWTDFLAVPVEGAILYVSEYTFPSDPNGMLEPGETAELRLTLQNPGTVSANAVYGQLFVNESWFTVNDDEGYFGSITAGGQGNNNTNRFEITAATQIIPGSQFTMEVQLYNADGYDDIAYFTITVGEAGLTDPLGPDAYGYYCYDDGDTDYYNVPVYDWIEINSIGTNLNLNDSGQTGDIEIINNLPISFKFYGIEYDDLTVCSNGWVAPGISGNTSFMNWHIPGPLGPSPQIAVFWDDLETAQGDVYYYYDAAFNYFIIEWDHLKNEFLPALEETFQLIIYDTNYYPTANGDSEMKFQYKVFNNVDVGSYPSRHGQYCTVGIEDHTGTRGLEYTFNNTYPPQAKVLGNETALLFTGPPIQFEEPYLVLGGVTLNDANGNGQADYGESVDIDIMLNNLGETPATGVSATVSTADPNVTITQNTSNYADVPGSGSSTNITPFTFDVAEDCPDGQVVSFEMNISSNEDSWIVYFLLELNAPIIEFHSVFIDDGDNNILDPGETVDIYVSFINNGGSDAYNAVSEISTSDTYITINSSTHNIGDFNAGSIITALFNISVANNTPLGHVSDISAEINADLNYVNSADFILRIGFINEGFESGNFESFDWEMSGSANWLISTDAIEGIYSARSGAIGNSQTTSLYLTMDVLAAGDISFYRKVSSENNYDYLKFYVNNQLQGQWCGTVSWSQVTYPVPAGTNVEFKWTYYKDGSVSTGSDCTWIDDILFPPGGAISDMGFIAGTVSLFGGTGNIEDVTIAADNFIAHPDENGHYVLPLQAGTYDVSAELIGYIPDLEENVNVTTGQTTTVNFNLSALQAPENLSATVSSNDVYLEWEMPSDDNGNSSKLLIGTKTPSRKNSEKAEQTDELRNLTGFNVYRDNNLIAEITDPVIFSYWDEALNAGNYNYFVIAVYDESNSGPSNTSTAEVVLSAPTNLTAQWQQPDVYLSWDAPAVRDLAYYRIYRDNALIAENLTVTNYTDDNVPAGTYIYKVQAIYDGNWTSDFSNEAEITIVHAEEILPQVTDLEGNYPNPFNPSTTIRFSLNEDSFVSLEIYNIKGEKVRTLVKDNLPAQYHTIVWNGRDENGKQVSSGIYFYKMKAGEFTSTRKMIMMK